MSTKSKIFINKYITVSIVDIYSVVSILILSILVAATWLFTNTTLWLSPITAITHSFVYKTDPVSKFWYLFVRVLIKLCN